jgi:glutathione peroxidase
LIVIGSIVFISSCSQVTRENTENSIPLESFYDLRAKTIDGEIVLMSQYKGKKILIVNVASECGYTHQYEGLQELYSTNKDNLYILAFPSNDFMNQEPGSASEIKKFCRVNFGVKFDIFEKVSVTGKNIHPIYEWLSNKKFNGWNQQKPTWNFNKYLIDEKGNLIGYWAAAIDPLSDNILNKINN